MLCGGWLGGKQVVIVIIRGCLLSVGGHDHHQSQLALFQEKFVNKYSNNDNVSQNAFKFQARMVTLICFGAKTF